MKNVPPDIIFVLRVNLNSPSFNNQQWPTYQKKVTNLNTGLANLKILCFKVPVSLNKPLNQEHMYPYIVLGIAHSSFFKTVRSGGFWISIFIGILAIPCLSYIILSYLSNLEISMIKGKFRQLLHTSSSNF